MLMRSVVMCVLSLAVVAAAAAAVFAQAKEQTPTEFYMTYRAAFDKAKKIEELLPYMAAGRKKEIESTPAGERAKMFELVKMFGTMSNVKVSGENKTAGGATLMVDALDGDKAKVKCTITLVREGAAWKVDRESCKN